MVTNNDGQVVGRKDDLTHGTPVNQTRTKRRRRGPSRVTERVSPTTCGYTLLTSVMVHVKDLPFLISFDFRHPSNPFIHVVNPGSDPGSVPVGSRTDSRKRVPKSHNRHTTLTDLSKFYNDRVSKSKLTWSHIKPEPKKKKKFKGLTKIINRFQPLVTRRS